MAAKKCRCGTYLTWTPEADYCGRCTDQAQLLDEPKPERCPAYGKDCDCPPESAVRRICERTAANIHR